MITYNYSQKALFCKFLGGFLMIPRGFQKIREKSRSIASKPIYEEFGE
jgi:hypothetical protein